MPATSLCSDDRALQAATTRHPTRFAYDAAVRMTRNQPLRHGSAWTTLLLATALVGCPSKPEPNPDSDNPAATAAPTATATAAASAEVVFDPRNPPPGWVRCHRNHCHHMDGHVASYAQVMKEMGATRIKGQPPPKAAPPAPPDVGMIPMDADKSASGLVTRVIKKGSGKKKPSINSVVTVHYTGWTTDGKAFDSSIVRNRPARFPLNKVFPGWQEGIQLMVVGEERRFWIPQDLAFKGARGKPTGTLVFDVELLAISDP